MAIHYEWDCEEVAAIDLPDKEKSEVIDHFHSETFVEALARSKTEPGENLEWRIVLVRDNDDAQKGQRSWAYLEDGVLPESFEDAFGQPTAKVPARFVSEVLAATKQAVK
jgi:hypothetical protein